MDQEISKNKITGHDLLYGKHLQERPRKGAILFNVLFKVCNRLRKNTNEINTQSYKKKKKQNNLQTTQLYRI